MTKRQFVVLAFRLFALYLVFNVITNLGYFLSMLQFEHGFAGAALTAAFGIAILLFALSLLWRKSEWLMQKIFAIPSLSDDVLLVEDKPFREGQVEGVSEHIPGVIEMQDYYETPVTKESIELIAFSVVGLWAAFSYLPRLLSVLVGYFDSSSALSRLSGLYSISTIFGDAIPVALGLWLFLRPWQFQGWIEKFKPKGNSTEEIAN
jgi:uncharacterized membrane protein